MKKLIPLFIALIFTTFNVSAEYIDIQGTELFRINDKYYIEYSNGKTVGLDLDNRPSFGEGVYYHDGLIIYINARLNDYGWGNYRWGAVDLTGQTIVPFNCKKLKDVTKKKEYKNYSMSAQCREILNNAIAIAELHKPTIEFLKIKDKLDTYRESRFSNRYKIKTSNKSWDSDRLSGISCVVQNGKMALIDDYGNFLTNFDYACEDAWYSTKHNVFALHTGKEGFRQITTYSGTSLYNLNMYDFEYDRFYYTSSRDGKKYYMSDESFRDVPTHNTLDKIVTHMVNLNMSMWYQKDEFESLAEFAKRTTPEMCRRAQEYYAGAAVTLYLNSGLPRPFILGDYDRENEAFLIESPVGNVAMKIPYEKSMEFRNQWEKGEISFSYPYFATIDSCVTLQSLTTSLKKNKGVYLANASTPYSRYIMNNATNVTSPAIAVIQNPNPIDEQLFNLKLQQGVKKITPADVDLNIPFGKHKRNNAFALIIANEEYQSLSPVAFARNDGEILAKYFTQTLGIPESNVKTYFNATFGQMRQALTDIGQIVDAYKGDVDILVYYAGHGAPDDSTRLAFLLPLDAAGVNPQYCMSRDDMLREISAMKARNAVVMFDACFTGAERTEESGKTLSLVRGVEIEPEGPNSENNVMVFTATTGRQTAIPDRENSHGLFTYYLLKKLRESNGYVKMGELWEYLDDNIYRRSAVLGKVQRPSIYATGDWQQLPLLP